MQRHFFHGTAVIYTSHFELCVEAIERAWHGLKALQSDHRVHILEA